MQPVRGDNEVGRMPHPILEEHGALFLIDSDHLRSQPNIHTGGQTQELIDQVRAMDCIQRRAELFARILQVVGRIDRVKRSAVQDLEVRHVIGARLGEVEPQARQHPHSVGGDEHGRPGFAGEARLLEDLFAVGTLAPEASVISSRLTFTECPAWCRATAVHKPLIPAPTITTSRGIFQHC